MAHDQDSLTLDDVRQRTDVLATVTPVYITPAQVARCLPSRRGGRPVHVATVIRWIVDGTVSPCGETVRLKAVRLGGSWLTTAAWLDDYARRLTPTYGDEIRPRTSATRTRSAERAGKELDRIGI